MRKYYITHLLPQLKLKLIVNLADYDSVDVPEDSEDLKNCVTVGVIWKIPMKKFKQIKVWNLAAYVNNTVIFFISNLGPYFVLIIIITTITCIFLFV